MKVEEINAFASSVIDDLGEATAHSQGTSLGHLLAQPTPVIDDNNLLTVAVAASGLRNLADTLLAKTAAALDDAGVPARRRESIPTLLTAIGLPPIAAAHAARVGRALATLPSVQATLHDARLSGEHAHAVVAGIDHISRAVDDLDADTHADCVTSLLAHAACGTPAQVRQHAHARAIDLAPTRSTTPIAENRELNTMSQHVDEDGRTHTQLDLDVVAGEKLRTALDPLMTPIPHPDGRPDTRDTGQRRADAFEHLLDSYLNHTDRPTSGGVHPHLVVTAPAATVTPTTDRPPDDAARPPEANAVAVFDTGQPVTSAVVDLLACDADWTAIIADADSVPLDVKRMHRFFPAHLRRALIQRDRGCSFPGCGRPPSWTHAHHLIRWSDGGDTSLDNGTLLCQMHHTLIHHSDWLIRIGTDGHPWYSPPPTRPDAPRTWIRSHARRTLTNAATAAN